MSRDIDRTNKIQHGVIVTLVKLSSYLEISPRAEGELNESMNLYSTFSMYRFKCALQGIKWVRSDISMYRVRVRASAGSRYQFISDLSQHMIE